MAVTVVSTNTIVATSAYSSVSNGDALLLLNNVTMGSTTLATAVSVLHQNVNLQINGTVFSDFYAVLLDFGAADSRLEIASTGLVTSSNISSASAAIVMFAGGCGLFNAGQIMAASTIAVYCEGTANEVLNTGSIKGTTGVQFATSATNQTLVNYGSILASGNFDETLDLYEGKGVVSFSQDTRIYNGVDGIISSLAVGGSAIAATGLSGGLVVDNLGELSAVRGIGVDLTAVNAGQDTVFVMNRGSIFGATLGYMGSVNGDALVNKGLISGNIDMWEGADTFDTRRGQIEGTFLGGLGDDTVRGNAAEEEVFDGGGDFDTLGFRSGPKVSVALDGSIDNAGAATGDTYIGFEHINGSGFADLLIGSAVDNRLSGGSGVDTIRGLDGIDTLIGNRGADVLTGGAGDDVFLFSALEDCGDRITDFSAGLGNNDRIRISAADFGGGLVPGAVSSFQFITRADNLAQDADDLFVLRSTDKTLWFDADGNGIGAAVMVVDMQNTAVFTRADILLV